MMSEAPDKKNSKCKSENQNEPSVYDSDVDSAHRSDSPQKKRDTKKKMSLNESGSFSQYLFKSSLEPTSIKSAKF